MEQEHLRALLDKNLAERKRLQKENVQRLYSRKTIEQGFIECFELVGGIPRLAMWAADPDNYGEFLKLLVKFAPKELSEKSGQVINFVSSIPHSPLTNPKEVTEDGVIVVSEGLEEGRRGLEHDIDPL